MAEEDYADDPVFAEEQAHLRATYEALERLARTLADKLDATAAAAAADKEDMTDDLARNFASLGEAMEMHVDFAMVNSIVEAYNLSHDLAAEKLRAAGLLLEQPYFAKVVLRYKPGEPPKELYIGAAGASDENYKRLVVDWRSPVAEVYYNQDMGPTSYEANGRTISAELVLRRQFDIARDRLNAYFDSDVAIQDSLLLASLSKKRSARMQAITATIQKEQNLVVRHADVPALLVAGVAGSGKTSVLMQRIAYLFYRNRGNLDPRDVFLISPNPVFGRYVENVLPDLGERNPEILTYPQLMDAIATGGRASAGGDAVGLAGLARIDEALKSLDFEQADFKDVHAGGVRLISAGQIWQAVQKFKQATPRPHLITLVREDLLERLESRLKQLAASDEVLDEVASLPLDEQIRLFNGPFNPDGDEQARADALTYVREKFAAAQGIVERDEWVRVDRIAKRLLGEVNLSGAAWLYCKMGITGLGNANARYVMVDEVQDYTVDQLAVLARYFRRANFLLLGDPNQAIKPNTATFDEVRDVMRALRGEVEECSLATSYRSTPEITQLFAGLLPEEQRGRVQSIQREETAPVVVECEGDAARWEAELRRAVTEAGAEPGLTAVIVPWKQEARRVQDVLGEDAPALLGEGGSLPAGGCVLVTLPLAKGLEFDRVIVPDAGARLFPADDRTVRNRLYTTISRATRSIILLAPDALTPLLKR